MGERDMAYPYGDSKGAPGRPRPARRVLAAARRVLAAVRRAARRVLGMLGYLLAVSALTAGMVALLWKVSGR